MGLTGPMQGCYKSSFCAGRPQPESYFLWLKFCGKFSSKAGADSDAAKLQHSFWFCGGSVFGIPVTNVSGSIGRAAQLQAELWVAELDAGAGRRCLNTFDIP
jgi:hypothetical protein